MKAHAIREVDERSTIHPCLPRGILESFLSLDPRQRSSRAIRKARDHRYQPSPPSARPGKADDRFTPNFLLTPRLLKVREWTSTLVRFGPLSGLSREHSLGLPSTTSFLHRKQLGEKHDNHHTPSAWYIGELQTSTKPHVLKLTTTTPVYYVKSLLELPSLSHSCWRQRLRRRGEESG